VGEETRSSSCVETLTHVIGYQRRALKAHGYDKPLRVVAVEDIFLRLNTSYEA
jgi:hypothetical protein